jgi:hypothetical protein
MSGFVFLKQSLIDEDRKRAEPVQRLPTGVNTVHAGYSGRIPNGKAFPTGVSDLTRLEFHGPAAEIDLMRGPLAHLNADFFALRRRLES